MTGYMWQKLQVRRRVMKRQEQKCLWKEPSFDFDIHSIILSSKQYSISELQSPWKKN